MSEANYAVVTETELLSKTSDTENNFIERKTVHDHQGWLETVVAFANSCPIGQPGILYVGVDNNGKVHKQQDGFDFEKLQKSISAKITNASGLLCFTHPETSGPGIYRRGRLRKSRMPAFLRSGLCSSRP